MAKATKKKLVEVIERGIDEMPELTKASLVAFSSVAPVSANIDVEFKSGLGQVTAVLFRRGVLINMQSISTSGAIHFSEVQRGDSIAINGVCAGDATIEINVPTNPESPERFHKEIIMTGYTIL